MIQHSFPYKLRVLIVENNALDTRLLKSMLSKSSFGEFELATAKSLQEAFELLTKRAFDVVLLDLNLDDSHGLNSLESVRARFPAVAVVVNTGSYKEMTGLKAVGSGAQDYLIKGKYKEYGLVKSLYYAVERKRVEDEIKIAYANLKEAQTQLIQAEKLNVIGGLASGIAHEVKNPLATILYGVEFLNTKCSEPDEQITFTLQSIREAAIRANEIIKDLLDFASLANLNKQPEDINHVIEHALVLVRHQADKHQIRITKEFSPSLPLISIDANRMQQVIVDLVLNAIYAVRQDGTVTIRTHMRNFKEEDRVAFPESEVKIHVGAPVIVIEIEDSGEGIDQDILTKVFDPFFTTRRSAGGVGLGLSVVRTIVLSHDGLISLANRPNQGAVAKLILKV